MELDGLSSVVMPLLAVTLTFDLLIPKANQHIDEPKYTCDQNWVKFPSLVSELWCSQEFLDAQTRAFTHLRTNGQTKYRMPPALFSTVLQYYTDFLIVPYVTQPTTGD